MTSDITNGLADLIRTAETMTSDVGAKVSEILREGLENPLSLPKIRRVLSRVVEVVRESAAKRGDLELASRLDREGESLLEHIEEIRQRLLSYESQAISEDHDSNADKDFRSSTVADATLMLQSYNGIDPSPVRPMPIFHERGIAVNEGFVRTRSIELWNDNSRLEIHLAQFQQNYGRAPKSEELLSIMQGDLPLAGVETTDQFDIRSLAKSIAVNGVRKPPVIDIDGTLLDGNRRVTACYHILEDTTGAFKPEEKQRAEWMKVWQLTEHATDQDREAVIVSLNFEPDFKQDWPEYVKAQKVHADWEARLALEPRATPGRKRQSEIRTDIARKFALSTNEVARYVNMVSLAQEFEDHHVDTRSNDPHAVKHRTSERFQYFDELNKGKNAGGVNWSLNQDDTFKQLVFDLLYDGKFRNWSQIRDLKYVYENDDAVEVLAKAQQQADIDSAKEDVDDAISIARTMRAETRQTAANTKIRQFTEWLLDLPVKSFDSNEPGCVTQENLRRLWKTLRHVETYLEADETSVD